MAIAIRRMAIVLIVVSYTLLLEVFSLNALARLIIAMISKYHHQYIKFTHIASF